MVNTGDGLMTNYFELQKPQPDYISSGECLENACCYRDYNASPRTGQNIKHVIPQTSEALAGIYRPCCRNLDPSLY